MQNQLLLFVMGVDIPVEELRETLELAKQQDAKVMCLILSHMPTYPLNAYGALPYGGMGVAKEWAEELQMSGKRLDDAVKETEQLLSSENASGDVQGLHCVTADVREIVAQRALVCDVVTIAKNLKDLNPDVYKAASNGVLFDSPISLALNDAALRKPKRVFLAWNTELPASRAAHRALPILKQADEVIVGCVDLKASEDGNGEDPGADVARWLSHHGCDVTVAQYPSGGQPTSNIIKQRASEAGANLVVMGAYGRSRLREFILGGTTREMLEQSEIPVMMAH